MIMKTIKFKNYAGEEEVGNFYFNLSKGELVKMQMSAIDQRTESFQDKLEKIGSTLNGKALIEVIDEMIDNSYGVKTTDGKRFIKSPADLEHFKSTDAYSELIVELCTQAEAAATFVNGLVPTDLRQEVEKEVQANTARERSASQMQGFQKKAEAPTLKVVPDLPTVIEGTADPVFEGENKPDFSKMSEEELRKHFNNQ